MTLGEAFRIAFTAGSGRKRDESVPDDVERVDWTYGIIGILILIAAQAGLLFWSGRDIGADVLRDFAIVAFAVQRPTLRRLVRRDQIETDEDREAWKARARRQRYIAYGITTAVGLIAFLMSTKPTLW